MKIGELLELSLTKKMSDIAKESLSIGEKPTRDALKLAGCYSISGKRGWFFDGDKSVLEQSIYDFAPPKRINRTTNKATANVSTKEEKNIPTNEPKKEISKELTKEPSNVQTNVQTLIREEIKQAEAQTVGTNELTNVSTKEEKNVKTSEPKKTKELANVPTKEHKNIIRKRSSFDIDIELMKELKIKAVIHEKNVYEMVETAIRQYLKEL